jgi:TonB family protein
MIEIPGYTVLRLLGHGGMATVYLAQQKSLGRDVALKVLTPALASDPVATERFLREARVSAKLHHPNIVAIFDVGVHEGLPYMAIAFEPGGTVAGYANARNDPKVALRIIRDIANALDFAHRQGVVHRDVKPENILLRADGTCVLSDFGIAHAVESQTGLTREGTSVGTPHYMSPEQLRGEHVDARADIYSLGVVLFQLLTGELPYQGTDGWAIGMQHIGAPIPHLPPHLDWLQTFLDALLAKSPDRRLQSGQEVVQWIDARLSGQGPAMTVAIPSALPTYTQVTPSGARGAASIAILPFADLSQTKDQEYLADGLTEELCNLLARVPGLFVASRSSAARFKGSTAKLSEIGRELKVATVLEGSVRKFGERVRISLQLINVADGFQRWTETYDRTLTDVFAIQDEIAALVLTSLKELLLPDAEGDAAKKAALLAQERETAQAREREAEEAKARAEAERIFAEEQRQREIGERIMQKKREREEAERAATEQARRDEEERAVQAKQLEAERIAEAQRAREAAEAERRRKVEEERLAEEQRLREVAERIEAERLANEQRKREEEARALAERRSREEAARQAEARRVQQEAERIAAEAAAAERAAAERAAAEKAAAEKVAADRAAAAKLAADKVAAERAAAEKAAAEAAAAERAALEKAAAEKAAAERAAAERAAAERAAEERAAADRAAAQPAAAERAAAERAAAERAAAERATAEYAAVAAQPASAAPPANEAEASETSAESDPARAFASAYLAKPSPAERKSAPSSPSAPSTFTPARIGIAAGVLLVLLAGGFLVMQNIRQKNQVACQAAMLRGSGAADNGDFDQAAQAALDAHGVCASDSDDLLAALDKRVAAGKAMAQTCAAATTQAREQLHAGKPAAAAQLLAPAHEQCAAWPGFPELEALPANAQAQAADLVKKIEPLVKEGNWQQAKEIADQAAMLDADSTGLAALQGQIGKHTGETAAATAPPAPAPTPTAPPPPGAKPAAPVADAAAVAAAAAKAQAEKDKQAKLAQERAKQDAARKAAAVAAAGKPTPAAPAPVAPVPVEPAPAPTPPPAPAGRGNALVATNTPQPPYPPQALRQKLSGEVTVSFVVNTDGSVSQVHVVSAKPRGVFDRGVVTTVGRWRFQPVDSPQSASRTITFEP